MGNHLFLLNKKSQMNTLSILVDDIFTALTKACGYDIFIYPHDGLWGDHGCEVASGLFGFRRISLSGGDAEYTYLGYQAIVSRI